MKYTITDGTAVEYADTLWEASNIAEDWFDHLIGDERYYLNALPKPDLKWSTLDRLNDSLSNWCSEIAEACGFKDLAGNGSYLVSAADRMGISLKVEKNEH